MMSSTNFPQINVLFECFRRFTRKRFSFVNHGGRQYFAPLTKILDPPLRIVMQKIYCIQQLSDVMMSIKNITPTIEYVKTTLVKGFSNHKKPFNVPFLRKHDKLFVELWSWKGSRED